MSVPKLKQRLAKFIEEVDVLDICDEYDENGFAKEFRELRILGLADRENNTYPAAEGKKDENIKKNRYKDILPFDETRVKLDPIPDEPGSDYINANFIKGANDKTGYIACQGPLPHTVADFWRMLWQYKIEVLVMVCREVEKAKAKCERYWPKGKDEEREFGKVNVKLVGRWKLNEFFFMQTLNIWETGDEKNGRSMTHYHYTGWLDHDIPHDYSDVIDLITRMRESQITDDIPPVIHCSAGCGRTGTICAIDYAWNMLKTGKLTDKFSLYEIVKDMRSQRQSMVQTPEQYQVVHLAVKRMFEEQLELLEGHNYENYEVPESNTTSETYTYGNCETVKDGQTKAATSPVQRKSALKLTPPPSPMKSSPKSNVKDMAQNIDPGKLSGKPTTTTVKPNNLPNLQTVQSRPNSAGKVPTDKKLTKQEVKPLLSPKPVGENEKKTRPDRRPSLDATSTEDAEKDKLVKTSSLDPGLSSYENVRLVQEEAKRKQQTGKFVTRINVGAETIPVSEQSRGGRVEKQKAPSDSHRIISEASHTDDVTKPSIDLKTLKEMFGNTSSSNNNAPMQTLNINAATHKKGKAPQPATSPHSYANQNLPETALTAAKRKSANSTTSANSTAPHHQNQHSKAGAQEVKLTSPDVTAGMAQAAGKLPISNSGSKPPAVKNSTGAVPRNDPDPMYAEISRTNDSIANKPATPKTSISERLPVPVPVARAGPTESDTTPSLYEDVNSADRDYSYAEPNAINKWSLQEHARHGEQKAQLNNPQPSPFSFVKGSTYEDIDVGSRGEEFVVLGGLRDDLNSHPRPVVPEKTREAYQDDDSEGPKDGNKLKKLMNILKPKHALTGGKQGTYGMDGEGNKHDKGDAGMKATTSQSRRAHGVILFGNKEVAQFNKRGKRPKGARSMPIGWKHETSL